jgi:hypothetical protein
VETVQNLERLLEWMSPMKVAAALEISASPEKEIDKPSSKGGNTDPVHIVQKKSDVSG